jgi:O-acetyl-ADP-ribose deacetylase (regulator of RNase III)
MIHEVSGDILLSKANAIVHGVAPGDHMDTGLALALREQWPAMHKDFRHHCHQSNPAAGEVWAWGAAGGVRIVALFTQEPAGRGGHPGPAHEEYVNKALRNLKKLVEKEGYTSLALPRVGTGVGGLDWSDVKPLIEHHLAALTIPVYVYSDYRPGVAAKEG